MARRFLSSTRKLSRTRQTKSKVQSSKERFPCANMAKSRQSSQPFPHPPCCPPQVWERAAALASMRKRETPAMDRSKSLQGRTLQPAVIFNSHSERPRQPCFSQDQKRLEPWRSRITLRPTSPWRGPAQRCFRTSGIGSTMNGR